MLLGIYKNVKRVLSYRSILQSDISEETSDILVTLIAENSSFSAFFIVYNNYTFN